MKTYTQDEVDEMIADAVAVECDVWERAVTALSMAAGENMSDPALMRYPVAVSVLKIFKKTLRALALSGPVR